MEQPRTKRIKYSSSKKIYIHGESEDIRVAMREIHLEKCGKNDLEKKKLPALRVYDTSGVYSDPNISINFSKGIRTTRKKWFRYSKDLSEIETPIKKEENLNNESDKIKKPIFPKKNPVLRSRSGRSITQLYYARHQMITPEMEYVAIRENELLQALGLKSVITSEYVRREIAQGRAIIPANINHFEQEPMIIGRHFKTKVNNYICHNNENTSIPNRLNALINNLKYGTDLLTERALNKNSWIDREWIIRNSPIPIITNPLFEAFAAVDSDVSKLSWDIFMEILEAQAQQGVDCFILHASLLKEISESKPINNEDFNDAGKIITTWMKIHQKENFIFNHFDRILDLMKMYDCTLILGRGIRPNSLYSIGLKNYEKEFGLLYKLASQAKQKTVQTMFEIPGHSYIQDIGKNLQKQLRIFRNSPFLVTDPMVTDVAVGAEEISGAIASTLFAWKGCAAISAPLTRSNQNNESDQSIKNQVTPLRIAAHIADLGKEYPGTQLRDHAVAAAQKDSRTTDTRNLSLIF